MTPELRPRPTARIFVLSRRIHGKNGAAAPSIVAAPAAIERPKATPTACPSVASSCRLHIAGSGHSKPLSWAITELRGSSLSAANRIVNCVERMRRDCAGA